MTTIAAQSLEGSSTPNSTDKAACTLYDARAVALATFLGTPVAGGILIALNYRRIGRPGTAVKTMIAAIVGTGLLILVGWDIPHGLDSLIAIGVMFAMKAIAKSFQGHTITEHVAGGGKLASMWSACWIGLATLAALFGCIFLVLYMKDRLPGVMVGSKDEVFYSGSATKEEAQALGTALKTDGYFSDKGTNVILVKGKDGTKIQFVVKEGVWNQVPMVEGFEIVGQQVAASVGGLPIEVDLLNKERVVEMNSNVGKVAADRKDSVYYLGAATETDAQSLGEALKTAGFFQGNGSDVFLSKHADGTMISFVVNDGVWDNPSSVKGFEDLARKVAPAAGGTPLKLRLMSTALVVKKDEML
ncbi:MAG TPA: hypothetical protein VK574_13025 [Terracidiphilus sp.]|nr:hypothetical protein [Terracidiphilus sp.]